MNNINSVLYEDLINQARRVATRKHNDTKAVRRHTGAPYIVHPEGVAKIATAYGLDKNQIAAAWLHDTIEDAGENADDLAEKFGPDVAELVSELTTDNDFRRKFGKEAAINNELENMTSRALDIKLCDMLYNINDFAPKSQSDRIKRHIAFLRQNRDLTNTQEELCDAIAESLKVNDLINVLREMTIPQLRNGYTSGITQKYWEIRQQPSSYNAIGVTDAKWDNSLLKDTLWLKFEVSTTGSALKNYTLELLFNKPKPYLDKFFAAKTWNEQKQALLDLFNKCDVKMHSNDPSWYWQGMWEDDYKKGLAIYKFKGTHGKGIWRSRHTASGGLNNPPARLTKHLYDLILDITTEDDLLKHIAQALQQYAKR